MTEAENEKIGWTEVAAEENEQPNIVRLELPRSSQNDGAAWVYLPSKDTIYIGPPGSYHLDITHSLKTLVDKQRGEKPITGVLYDDGFADYFDKVDKTTLDRILKTLQMYHDENYNKSFNKAEDDAGAWDHNKMIYPSDEDYEDPDEKSRGGLDYIDPEDDYGDNEDSSHDSIGDYWDQQAWGPTPTKHKDEYQQMKPTPGEPKPIGEWDIQDYLNWRDKKYWNAGGVYATPREDYPHFRWSYGDSRIMPGCPHEGLWVWPTHNGYPDHYSQTGHQGLGNCAQGRIYPHQGDRWEILTWPQRPRNAPSEATRDYIQREAQQAVKEYVMDRIGVPEDKIFFTNMHYTAAVSMYNSPSYPDDDYFSSPTNNITRDFHYDWEPLEDWNSLPEGTWNSIKDPSGREWKRSSLEPDKPGYIRLFAQDGADPKTYEVNPERDSTAGWEIGKKVYEPEPNDTPDEGYGGNENPYDWKPEVIYTTDDQLNRPTLQELYNRIIEEKNKDAAPKQIGPPPRALEHPDEYHKNSDGTYSRLVNLPTQGPTVFTWNGTKWSFQKLTPEEAYETRVRWHEEDEAKRKDIARTMFPEAFGDTGDELDENGELVPTSGSENQLYSFKDPESNNMIHVTPEDYELSYRLHGDNWWKSFIPNRKLTSENDFWSEVI